MERDEKLLFAVAVTVAAADVAAAAVAANMLPRESWMRKKKTKATALQLYYLWLAILSK